MKHFIRTVAYGTALTFAVAGTASIAAQPVNPSGSVSADQTAVSATPDRQGSEGQSEAEDLSKVRCERYAQTGTRVKKKVCHTLAEWKQIEENAERNGRNMQDQGGVNSTRYE